MRIVYLSLQSTSPGTAAHAHVHEIIAGLRKRGMEVELHDIRYPTKLPGIWMRFWTSVALQAKLAWRLATGRRTDLLYVRFHLMSFLAVYFARIWLIPVVLEVNGIPDDFFQIWPSLERIRSFVLLTSKSQCRLASRICTDTSGRASWLERNFGIGRDRLTVIPNAANTKLFHPIEKPELLWRELHGLNYCLFVGALSRWHGLEVMLDALVSDKWPKNLHLVIVGDGQMREEVLQQSRSLKALIYLGSIPYTHVPRVINGSLFCLSVIDDPSRVRHGASPLKLFEYLACGKPVIVSEMPGQVELVSHLECGLIIPPGDAEALCEAAKKLMNEPELRESMGRRGLLAVQKDHSWDQRSEVLCKMLEGVIGR